MSDRIINYVGGNARVGLQAQNVTITGGIHMNGQRIEIGGEVIADEEEDE